jgi:hypothetical protein
MPLARACDFGGEAERRFDATLAWQDVNAAQYGPASRGARPVPAPA